MLFFKSLFKNPWWYGAVAVLCASVFLFLFQLGAKPFWDYDEAIYANVVHDTIASGNVLELHRGTNFWFEKPPLAFWLGMWIDSVVHHPEFSYRLTAALSGILSIVLVMLITYEVRKDIRLAVAAGLVLLLTGPFLEAGREFRLDIPATSMVLLSSYSFLRGLRDPRWFLGVGVGLGIGFLFKSVIGLLSLLFIFLQSISYRNFHWTKNPYFLLSGVIFLAIVAPWHIYETVRHGEGFWQNYFFYHVLQRFSGDVIGGSVSAWQYLSFFFTYVAPWSILFGFLIIWIATKFQEQNKEGLKPLFVFAGTALCLIIVFLLAATKIFSYLLPVYPFIAIALALALGHFVTPDKKYRQISIILSLLLPPIFIFAVWMSINFGFHKFSYIVVNDIIVSEEKSAALIIAQDKKGLEVYSYQYDYYDTIEYYSGIKTIYKMSDNQELDKPFFLLVSKPYMDWHTFPSGLAAHLEVMYKGRSLILYKFKP